jgi:hypothetical protein
LILANQNHKKNKIKIKIWYFFQVKYIFKKHQKTKVIINILLNTSKIFLENLSLYTSPWQIQHFFAKYIQNKNTCARMEFFLDVNIMYNVCYFFIIINVGVRISLRTCTLTNLTSPEVNDHVNLHWPSY